MAYEVPGLGLFGSRRLACRAAYKFAARSLAPVVVLYGDRAPDRVAVTDGHEIARFENRGGVIVRVNNGDRQR